MSGPNEAPAPEYVHVRWAGQVRRVEVVKRFKNGKVRVEIPTRWLGGRPGSAPRPERPTVEAWQIVPDEQVSS